MAGDQFEFVDESEIARLVGTLHDPGATVGDVLTVQADKSIKAAAGGGSQPVQRVQVTIAAADVLTLATVPIKLVDAGADAQVVPLALSVSYIFGTTPYTDHGGTLNVGTGLAPVGGGKFAPFDNYGTTNSAGFWDQTENVNLSGIAAFQAFGLDTFAAWAAVGGGSLWIVADNDPTGGDGELFVDITYSLLQFHP